MPSSMEPDWRDPAGYRALLALDRRGFAWEFLRRNLRYRVDARLGPPVRRTRLHRQVEVIEAPPGGAARWGLWFPGESRLRCPHCVRDLAGRA